MKNLLIVLILVLFTGCMNPVKKTVDTDEKAAKITNHVVKKTFSLGQIHIFKNSDPSIPGYRQYTVNDVTFGIDYIAEVSEGAKVKYKLVTSKKTIHFVDILMTSSVMNTFGISEPIFFSTKISKEIFDKTAQDNIKLITEQLLKQGIYLKQILYIDNP
jgi:hypothetical protein